MKRIQAKKHKIGTYEINKISLLCFDDKIQVLDDGILLQLISIKIALQVVRKLKKVLTNKKHSVVLYMR